MLTRKSYKYLGHHFFIASLICMLPFKWNFKTETLSMNRNKLFWLIMIINSLVSYVMTLNTYYSIVSGILNGDRKLANLVTDIMFGIAWTAQPFFQLKIFLNAEEMVDMLNHIFSFDKIYTGKYLPPQPQVEDNTDEPQKEGKASKQGTTKRKLKAKKVKEPTDGCDGNIFASLYMMFVYSLITIAFFLKKPDDSRFMYRLIPEEYKSEWTMRAWAAMEYFHVIKFCFVFNNTFYIIMLYAHCTNYWLHELSKPGAKSEDPRKILVPVARGDVIKNYKAIQVLNVQFNECSSGILLPTFKCVNMGLHVMALYCTITYYDAMPLEGFMVYPIGAVMWFVIESDVYTLLGQTNTLSESFLQSWKTSFGTAGDRYFRSMFLLGIKVSDAYTIERSTLLTVWSTVFNMVINCILF